MKINSLRKLDRNDYERIVIRTGRYGETIVDIKNDNKYPTLKTNLSFSNSIKNLNVHDKVKEIIRYFLRNTNINYIKENQNVEHFNGLFLVLGNNSRKLLFKNLKNIIDNDLKKDIINKYNFDRYKLLNNNSNIKNICFNISDKCDYYVEKEDYLYESSLIFNLKTVNDTLVSIDKDFFLKVMNSIINSSENIIKTENVSSGFSKKCYRLTGWFRPSFEMLDKLYNEKSYFNEYNSFYLYIDDYKIRIPINYYLLYLKEQVDKHNEIINGKKLQLNLFKEDN